MVYLVSDIEFLRKALFVLIQKDKYTIQLYSQ